MNRRTALQLSVAATAAPLLPVLGACSGGSLAAGAVEALLASNLVPGASALAIENGEPTWSQTYGLARTDGNETIDPQTRFQAASVTKMVNALLVLALARDGRIDLDGAANRYLSGWQLRGIAPDTVTVAMLLSHTGGTSVPGFLGYEPGGVTPTVDAILAGLPPANSAPVLVIHQPGIAVQYSGGGTTVLQKLVSDVTGESYDALLRRLVLTPLGMTQSSIDQPPPAGFANYACGHDQNGKMLPGGYAVHPELAAAGLWSTPADLAKPIAAIIASVRGAPNTFLPQPLAQRMVTPVVGEMGLGVFIDRDGWFYHPGGNRGFRSHIRANYNTGEGLVIMTNGDNGSEVITQLQRLISASRA